MLATGAGDRTSQGPLSREDCRAVAASICPSRTWQHWPGRASSDNSPSFSLSRLQPTSSSSSIQSSCAKALGLKPEAACEEWCWRNSADARTKPGTRSMKQETEVVSTGCHVIKMMKWRKWRTLTLSLLGQSSPWVWELVCWIEGCLSCKNLVEVSWGSAVPGFPSFPAFPGFQIYHCCFG